ncbi:sugar/nucleoside kinase (ribokinase family) [Microcella putealis]|uniref:Sugar/nucleoside kinase (Ribokinase family) n=1 Tax=Microcella putealis TaxID=337005 RepID=A0A4Q7LNW5_9MICO|nr:carbohydrate kinase family protein [Microcella putealis]RZS56395.1 sugar/nucleoside kinase (ribokinase family) [Microcella putealis]TQM27119.1 sugar/nucleoside kinase (ribokinase family) [Microcella putealis]
MSDDAPRILVVGDVINDIVVLPSEELRPDTDTASTIIATPGGSAANTAAWVGWHGVPVDFVGRVGAGDAETHRRIFAEAGVTAHLAESTTRGTGTIVIIAEGERRTMLTDRGANDELDPASVTDELLERASVLHLTGYGLVNAFTADDVARLIARAREHGVKVSLDPGSVGFISDYGPAAFRRAVTGVDLLLPNLAEARLLIGQPEAPAAHAAVVLLDVAPLVMLTDGARGVIVAEQSGVVHEIAVDEVPTVDSTGAGDAFGAGVLVALATGQDVRAAAAQGMRAAAIAVSRAGGRPPAGRGTAAR